MFYLDTSFIIPLFINESNSAKVRRWFENRTSAEVAISDWTCVEFASAMGMNVRAGAFSKQVAAAAIALFEEAAESLTVLLPDRVDYRLAQDMLLDHARGLRAGDALHLAIASNRDARKLLTFDRRMIKGAKSLKISAGFS